MKQKRRGFTLIELMIVIAIIAILASILVPNFLRARAQGQYNSCIQNIKNIATAVEMYGVDYGEFPSTGGWSAPQLLPDYLKTWPKCPAGGEAYYYARYDSTPSFGGKLGYFVGCYRNPSPHAAVGIDPYAPAYTNKYGWALKTW